MDANHGEATIMVVDDTPDNLALLEGMLLGRGYRILELTSGKQALKAIEKCLPDLILMDIMMPDMDGFEVCRRIKADKRFSHIPVIFISAIKELDIKLKALESGIDYVSKPFQEPEVLARVETHLRVQRLQRKLAMQNQHLERLVREKVKLISDSHMATIAALTRLTESRDNDTGLHIERTREYCRILAEKLKADSIYADRIGDAFIENIYHAAPLHDIGKVGISDTILLKPGKLTAGEFEIIKTHTVLGAETLESVREKYPGNAFINMGVEIARSHHERWDGSGYPDGLVGKQIPLSARIMAVADVYDALRSRRPYKESFSHEKACDIIRSQSGSQFDPVVVSAFAASEAVFEDLWDQMKDDPQTISPVGEFQESIG